LKRHAPIKGNGATYATNGPLHATFFSACVVDF
jgi:hypothetical protein